MLRCRLCCCQVAFRRILGILLVLEPSEIFYVDRHSRQICIFWFEYARYRLLNRRTTNVNLRSRSTFARRYTRTALIQHCLLDSTLSDRSHRFLPQTLTKDVDELYANPLWLSIHEKRFKDKAKSETLPAHAPKIVQHVSALSFQYAR